jgi:hypothetical protein
VTDVTADGSQKQAKGQVDYSRGMKASHCGICRYYRRGSHGTMGTCQKVAGSIDPSYWCKLFRKK